MVLYPSRRSKALRSRSRQPWARPKTECPRDRTLGIAELTTSGRPDGDHTWWLDDVFIRIKVRCTTFGMPSTSVAFHAWGEDGNGGMQPFNGGALGKL